jgi:methyl-accepting chemotaxis protein
MLGFSIFGWLAWKTLNLVKINGPLYQQIALGKDLVADVLPPPEYILEAYLTTLQLQEESDPAKIQELIEKVSGLRKDFIERHQYWSTNLSDSELKSEVIVRSFEPATSFLEGVEKERLHGLTWSRSG